MSTLFNMGLEIVGTFPSALDLTEFSDMTASKDADVIRFLFRLDEAFEAPEQIILTLFTDPPAEEEDDFYEFTFTRVDADFGGSRILYGFIPDIAVGDVLTLAARKNAFAVTGDPAWTSITEYRFIITWPKQLVSSINAQQYIVTIDNLELFGFEGDREVRVNVDPSIVAGDEVSYTFTFANDDTGNRSNPAEDGDGELLEVKVLASQNDEVVFTGIPTSADGQVNRREPWRKEAGTTLFFKVDDVDDQLNDNTATTFTDQLSDLTTIDELEFDNAPPPDTFEDFLIDRATAFWLSSVTGELGLIKFSPIGRPESVKGFITVTDDTNPLRRLILWNGLRLAFGEDGIYLILGLDPYATSKVTGAPGVTAARQHTVVSTPSGVIYQSNDGFRIYNGTSAPLLFPEAIAPVLRGESREDFQAFSGVVATFARGEYFVASTDQTLVFHVEEGTWREHGLGNVSALFYEPSTDKIVIGHTASTFFLEEQGVLNDGGGPIIVSIETGAHESPSDSLELIERVLVRASSGSPGIDVSLVSEEETRSLGTLGGPLVEFRFDKVRTHPSIRVSGNVLDAQAQIDKIELDTRSLDLNFIVRP
ncbi:MAG: hypothetical protein V3W09_04115 [Nitrososphaerales archaeon]